MFKDTLFVLLIVTFVHDNIPTHCLLCVDQIAVPNGAAFQPDSRHLEPGQSPGAGQETQGGPAAQPGTSQPGCIVMTTD